MNCTDFDGWLDAGMPAPAAAARAHAAGCARCAEALRAALELDALLAAGPAAAPAAFTDRVMARIDRAAQARRRAPRRVDAPLAWWIRAAAQPAAALAALLAAALTWQAPALWAVAASLGPGLDAALGTARMTPHLAPGFAQPDVLLGLALAAAPAAAWASWLLFRWAEGLSRAPVRPAARQPLPTPAA